MNRKMLASCAALALVLGFSSLAEAGCSPEEAQQKALAFSQVIQEESQKNPENYAKIMQELQPELLQLQQKQDLDALCVFYDKAMERAAAVPERKGGAGRLCPEMLSAHGIL